ncbi:hypothetical protein [Haliangium sp.]|uniref:hypothetical protein n=1 Tax=Haliangium sp. TaxID=2663208 RepID=UPI003D0E903A
MSGFQKSLEDLRSQLVDLEAVAHAAENALQELPYAPSQAVADPGESYSDAELGMGRLQTLVLATSSSARTVLKDVDELIERLYRMSTSRRSHGGDGGGSSRACDPNRPGWPRAA